MTDSEEETVERQLKIIFLGDPAVGKVCFLIHCSSSNNLNLIIYCFLNFLRFICSAGSNIILIRLFEAT